MVVLRIVPLSDPVTSIPANIAPPALKPREPLPNYQEDREILHLEDVLGVATLWAERKLEILEHIVVPNPVPRVVKHRGLLRME